MREERNAIVSRGRRSPTNVWIEKRSAGVKGPTYRLRWVDPVSGKVLSQSCGRDRAAARIMRSRKSADLREGLSGRLPTKTLTDLITSMPTFMVGKSKHTIDKTVLTLENMKTLCGDRLLEHVGRELVMDYRARRVGDGVSLATVNKGVREIRSALSYAHDAGWIRFNPLLRWKQCQVREPEKTVRVIEPADFAKLLTATEDPVFRVLLIVAYHQGMRRTELCNLRWNAVDLDKGVIRVVNRPEAGELTKSRKNRTIPMHPTVKVELAKMRKSIPTMIDAGNIVPKSPHVFVWDDGIPFKPDWVTHRFAKIAKDAGVKAILHDLRRSFSTLAQRAGVDRMTVKDLGGWSSVSVVEKHYTGEIQPALERAMERIAKAQGA